MITRVSFFVGLLCMALVNSRSNRIIGGDRANPGQFKYQISLQIKNKHCCGGAIIADQYILTAAHCVVDINSRTIALKEYQVVAGSDDLSTNEGVRVDVEKIYVPMKFLTKNWGNKNDKIDTDDDIAVLKLDRGLGLSCNPNLQKINLPPSRELSHVSHTAVMAGYGLIYVEVRTNPKTGRQEEVNGRSDNQLKYAMVNIISNQDCARINHFQKITEKHICGQCVQRGRQPEGLCTGDSGGALVRGNIIIGVSSNTPMGCNEWRFAAVYTKVSFFVNFIERAMKDIVTRDMAVHEIRSGESSSGSKRDGKLEAVAKDTESKRR